MKKIWMMLALATLLVGCNNEEFDSALNVYSLKGYADTESRTAFGSPTDNSIPFEWCAGDYVYVGNVQSNALTNGGSSATFTFGTTPTATNVYYNMTGSSATEVVVKSEQAIGNLGENGDFGYSTINNGSFTLQHATAYVWFDVTTSISNTTLQSINLSVDGENIAGKAIWNGSSFGATSEGKNFVELNVNKTLSSTNNEVWTMVVLPADLTNKTVKVTYKLNVGNATKYYSQPLNGKKLIAGTTQKVSANISANDLKDYLELRVLTFEDDTEKFETYTITGYDGDNDSYYDHSVTKWSDLIDTPEYGGPLAYGDMGFSGEGIGCDYNWYDKNNTFLASEFPINYNSKVYWGGGHVISSYASEDYTTYGTYNNQQTVYGEGQEYGVTKTGGRNGSSNFAMHFGYKDGSPYNMTENLPYIYFKDNTPRIIDHMYVNNSAYAISCYMDGNGLTAKIGEEDWVKAIATGYDIDGNVTGTAEIYLCNGPDNIVTEWTKWDLTSLGMVYKVEFNITGSSDNGFGFSQPAYFAYDDVAVQFTE